MTIGAYGLQDDGPGGLRGRMHSTCMNGHRSESEPSRSRPKSLTSMVVADGLDVEELGNDCRAKEGASVRDKRDEDDAPAQFAECGNILSNGQPGEREHGCSHPQEDVLRAVH